MSSFVDNYSRCTHGRSFHTDARLTKYCNTQPQEWNAWFDRMLASEGWTETSASSISPPAHNPSVRVHPIRLLTYKVPCPKMQTTSSNYTVNELAEVLGFLNTLSDITCVDFDDELGPSWEQGPCIQTQTFPMASDEANLKQGAKPSMLVLDQLAAPLGEENIGRCFIAPGRVAKSLYSIHLEMLYQEALLSANYSGDKDSDSLSHPNTKSDATCDPFGGAGDSEQYRKVCLVDAINALGVSVPYTSHGPFRALTHGNPMLQPFGYRLLHVSSITKEHGKYVRWLDNHHSAVIVGSVVTVIERSRSFTVRTLAELPSWNKGFWYRLVSASDTPSSSSPLSPSTKASIDERWSQAKRRKVTVTAVSSSTSKALRGQCSSGITDEQLARIVENRRLCLERRSRQLVRPLPPLGWNTPQAPDTPADFSTFSVELPRYTFLEHLNAHPRDRHIQFFSDTHTYLIAGRKTLGSVTGLVHAFAQAFVADHVIQRMQRSSNWPRAGYIRSSVSPLVLDTLKLEPDADGLVTLLQTDPIPQQEVCALIRSLRRSLAVIDDLVPSIAMSSAQIQEKWDLNRDIAANQGTWMHFLFEACILGQQL